METLHSPRDEDGPGQDPPLLPRGRRARHQGVRPPRLHQDPLLGRRRYGPLPRILLPRLHAQGLQGCEQDSRGEEAGGLELT